jgi:LmbE family N-acetylglucosaminyl deacetylase
MATQRHSFVFATDPFGSTYLHAHHRDAAELAAPAFKLRATTKRKQSLQN